MFACPRWGPNGNHQYNLIRGAECNSNFGWRDIIGTILADHKPKMIDVMDKMRPGIGEKLQEETSANPELELGERDEENQAGNWLRSQYDMVNGETTCWLYSVLVCTLVDILEL